MNARLAALTARVPESWGRWLSRAWSAAIVLGLGVVIGMQYMTPNSRVIGVLVAVVVLGIAWRLDIVSGVGVMVLALPFPRGTTFGNTNFALILLLLMVYLLRVGQRQVARPRSTPIDWPIAGLVIAYIVSFYNVRHTEFLPIALSNTEMFAATLLTFFLVVNSATDEKGLRRIHNFQIIALTAILVIACFELTHPGQVMIPGWIDFSGTHGSEFDLKNVRVGSVFYDYELLADFCGLNLLFVLFRLARARNVYERTFMGALLGLTMFILFCTVTRGPVVSLGAVIAYMLWRMRRRLRVVPLTIIGAGATASIIGMNFVVSNYTRSGDLFARVGETTFVGVVPDSRVAAWQSATERFLLHPIIGSGPYYVSSEDIYTWYWPHCLYLYIANIVGLVGLTFFLWMLWSFVRMTRTKTDTFASPSYTESYLFLARFQLVFFLIDQIKIEYLRNSTYQFQIWMMFALWAAAERIHGDQKRAAAALAAGSGDA